MTDFYIAMTFFVFIPLFVAFYYSFKKSVFLRLVVGQLLLSMSFDIIGTICAKVLKTNVLSNLSYTFLHILLLGIMWSSYKNCKTVHKRIILLVTIVAVVSFIGVYTYNGFNIDTVYRVNYISTLYCLILTLLFFYLKMKEEQYIHPLKDSSFIVASAYLLYCLATIVILVGQVYFKPGTEINNYTWTTRQIFYGIFNIIIAYAFYVEYKNQRLK